MIRIKAGAAERVNMGGLERDFRGGINPTLYLIRKWEESRELLDFLFGSNDINMRRENGEEKKADFCKYEVGRAVRRADLYKFFWTRFNLQEITSRGCDQE